MQKFLTILFIVGVTVFGFYLYQNPEFVALREELKETETEIIEDIKEEEQDVEENDEKEEEVIEENEEEPAAEAEEKPTEDEAPTEDEVPTNSEDATPEDKDEEAPPKIQEFSSESTIDLDDTWQEFESSNGSIGFSYPTRGSHAPEWELSSISAGDEQVIEDCYFKDHMNIENRLGFRTSDNVFSCHTWAILPDDSTTIREDFVLIPGSSGYLLISFTIDESRANFVREEYLATLAKITSTVTFK